MSSDTHCCVICRLPLPVSGKRRLINPVTEANAGVHEFFVRYVAPGYVFSPSDSSKYMCKNPCFADVEKAMKRHLSLQELLGSIRGQLNMHPKSPDSASSHDSLIAASSQSVSRASSRNKLEVSNPNACQYTVLYYLLKVMHAIYVYCANGGRLYCRQQLYLYVLDQLLSTV